MDAVNPLEDNSAGDAGAADDESTRASVDYARIVAARSYDEPYRFGRQPTSRAPFPFTEREFVRLLILRSRIRSGSAFDPAEA